VLHIEPKFRCIQIIPYYSYKAAAQASSNQPPALMRMSLLLRTWCLRNIQQDSCNGMCFSDQLKHSAAAACLLPCTPLQLEVMSAAEAATLLAQLFDEVGGDVDDAVAVSSQEALFNTADADYNQELAVLEALLDQGIQAPRFTAPGQITAGKPGPTAWACVSGPALCRPAVLSIQPWVMQLWTAWNTCCTPLYT